MPPLELDKPSKAPFENSETDEDEVQIHDVDKDGRHGAVFRDPKGSLIYPAYIPPDTESPASPASQKSLPAGGLETSKPDEPPDPAKGPRKTHSQPLNEIARQLPSKSSKQDRPSMDKKFLTELSRRNGRQISAFRPTPAMRRAGTNVSQLDRVLWDEQNRHMEAESSSSSSSEDEDEGDAPAPRPKRKTTEDRFGRFRIANENYSSKGKFSKKDGRLNITLNDKSNTGYLAKALGAAVKTVMTGSGIGDKSDERPNPPSRLSSATTTTSETARRPKLNIVIMVIGSRGDAQPFLKIGKVLKEEYGHHVRIATHPAFKEFVQKDSGLEFFSVGGDPSELMAFMVKNPGLIPKLESVKAGDIGKRRAAMAEMFDGFWRACINATDNEKDIHNLKMMGTRDPFIADAIIANPPSFAHMHCAEALGIPLHLMFTFPYTPTQAFPHPLATIKKTNVDPGYTNFMSYPLVEMMVWQGLGDLVNDFRVKTLGLDPVSTLWAPGATYRMHVPFTYLWSPGLVPKPEDWGQEIDISGFTFLDLASTFKPPNDLVKFLDAGEAPIYIGFGSIVVDDADRFTEMIFEGVRQAGVRALVSKGWGGLGQDNVPENIYMLENTPHDWLFPKVRACVIHGGAGTTAIALKCGKPTMVVPFFGDQHFWGSMLASAKAGPQPVPYKKLNEERLAEGIKYCLTEEASKAAQEIARSIELEGDGAKNAVRSFHRHLDLAGEKSMRCSILDDRVAVWNVKNTSLKLSALAADLAAEKGLISWRSLRLIRHKEWNDFEGPGEPVTGITGSLVGAAGDVFSGIGSVPYRLAKTSNKRAEHKKKKEERRKQRQKARSAPAAGYPFPQSGAADTSQQSRKDGAETSNAEHAADNGSVHTAATPGTVPLEPAQEEYMNDVQEGVGKSGRALARAPVDVMLSLAQGLHNAPRLYGDDTVRKPVRVTGMRSGLKAAKQEFVYGIYDGVTGLVRLPVRGAKENGIVGAFAGFGMGLTGFVLKDLAAIAGPVGYTLKGLAKQASRSEHSNKYLRRGRIIQGQREWHLLPQEERKSVTEDVVRGWDVMRELADIIMDENAKRGIKAFFGHGGKKKDGHQKKALGKWGRGPAFESVETAQRAIIAIKKGADASEVLGKSSKSMDQPRKSLDTSRKSIQESRKSRDTRRMDRVEEQDDETADTAQGDSKISSERSMGKTPGSLPVSEPVTAN